MEEFARNKATAEKSEITEEAPEKRSEFQKEFMLDSGMHIVTVYPVSVHYEESGKWKEWADLGKSAASGAFANGVGYAISYGAATLKVREIDGMTRDAKKAYLRDAIFHDSQQYVNQNLRIFSNSSQSVKRWLVQNGLAVFRAGVYSTASSTIVLQVLK